MRTVRETPGKFSYTAAVIDRDNSNSDSNSDFASLLAEFEKSNPSAKNKRGPNVGDVVSGKVLSIGQQTVFIDIGGKSEGMLDLEQVRNSKGELICAVGDIIEARVVEVGGPSGVITLRRSMGKGPDAIAELGQAFEHQIPVDGLVAAVIKGGFEITVAGSRGFCPISQIDSRFVEDPEVFVGQKLAFRITKLQLGRGGQPDIVLSRRALLEEEAAVLAAELRQRLEVGLVTKGVVTTIKPYGAFIDLGGLEGMLHISELGHTRVAQVSDVLAVGQTVEVQVTKIEPNRDPKRAEKISLSLKSMEKDPWIDAQVRFAPGSVVSGEVVRVQPFGAFVELAPGLDGLIHISELAVGRRISNPRDVVRVGDKVTVTVLGVEVERRRISLSLSKTERDAAEREEADIVATHAPKSQGFGTFAELLNKAAKK